jgi:hypothetical protein
MVAAIPASLARIGLTLRVLTILDHQPDTF